MNGNENIVNVETIENLLCSASAHNELIHPNNMKVQTLKEQLAEEINDIQTGTLHALRILCEGD